MRTNQRRSISVVASALSLLLLGNTQAQTNAPRLEVSGYACRGPDKTHPGSSLTGGGPQEFRITIVATNKGAADVSLQRVETAIGPASGGTLRISTTGSKETMI